ncbi:MAG: hypothetical protein PQ612_06460 [Rickettsiales bacterium]|nr:hypothetical protein [Pseudomonadota bacterium]MDA0966615.1 hypothetical protein [Pseudomonadota bacterium]MDG4543643.1 hypothetical protein [Rickettsiales bacterium]MDG4545790.1 hypothetical protein [Rickettsiales bacterium]MDG4547436.1 hypothetical protein [Rickettsiales bacterium]
MEKYYVDSNGNYLGAFQGRIVKDDKGKILKTIVSKPANGIEVPEAPQHGSQIWDSVNGKWSPYKPYYKDLRRDEYNRRGATLEALTILLWKKEEGEEVQAEIDAIRQIRAEVETMYPKEIE